VLQTTFKLFIIAKHHIERFFVFALPMNKSLEPLARNFNFMPSGFSSLSPNFLIALGVIQKQLLLLDGNIGYFDAIRPRKDTSIRVCVFQIS